MPSGSYIQQDILCPFYLYDDGARKITCEGFTHNTSMITLWHTHGDLMRHARIYCSGCYEKCEIYRMIMQAKYPDVEG